MASRVFAPGSSGDADYEGAACRLFGGINVLIHRLADFPEDAPATFVWLQNADLFQEGAMRLRGGLGRPASWPAMLVSAGKLTTGTPVSNSGFGNQILSLLPISFTYIAAPAIVSPESGTSTAETGTNASLATGLSTVARWSSVLGDRGFVYLCNGVDRARVWDGQAAAARFWGIVGPTVAPTAADGGGGGTLSAGSYTWYYAWYNSTTGVLSSASPISNTVTLVASHKGSISGVPAAPADSDSQVTHWRLYRNTAGQSTTYYKVADIAIGTTTYSDNNSDASISLSEELIIDRSYPLGSYPWCGFLNGRMFLYGSRIENQGTATPTSASANVAGTGTHFTQAHVGQALIFAGETRRYTILTVTSTTALTITPTYTGTGGSPLSYTIFASQAANVNWSIAGAYENFPLDNTTIVGANDGCFPTGVIVFSDSIYLGKNRRLYRWSWVTNPDPAVGEGRIFTVLDNRGLLNNRCSVSVDRTCYILDLLGPYSFDGAQAQENIDLPVRAYFQPLPGVDSTRQVNWAASETFHVAWEPKADLILFFVALGGDTKPKHCFCWDRTRQRWSVWSFIQAITSSCLMADSTGKNRCWVGDDNGYVWALNVNPGLDGSIAYIGASEFTVEGVATGGTDTTLVDSGASFYSTGLGLAGVPLLMYTAGSPAVGGLTRIITASSSGQLTFSEPVDFGVSAGTPYMVGPVLLHFVTQGFHYSEANKKKRFQGLTLFHETAEEDTPVWVQLVLDDSASVNLRYTPSPRTDDGWEVPVAAPTDGYVAFHMDEASGSIDMPISVLSAVFLQVHLWWYAVEHSEALNGFTLWCSPNEGNKSWRNR